MIFVVQYLGSRWLSVAFTRRRSRSSLAINISQPHLLYDAHTMKREVTIHCGPTNSGKTHTALMAMKNAGSGVYCGPLRLLAWEVSEKLRDQGIQCDLVTGQEREIYEGPGGETAAFTACTVEMMDVYRTYDVGVIDEFQLVGDFSRGWAWTRAFMGMQAKQIHLCGSPSMIDIVEKLCRQTGDTLRVVRYERLSPLQVGDDALRNYKNIRPGDCVIGFSRHVLYTIKSQIEQCNHNIRCCVIYGSLPPATRKEQAKLFNSTESKYDVLVASDAVGLGLNLSIRRVILSTLEKYDGRSRRGLYSSEIKQIGGRAGRYNSVFENGEVITLYRKDMNRLTSALHDEDRPVKRAGLSPTIEQLELLGIVEDLDVTEDDLIHFWNDITTEEWGDDITLPESAIKNQLSTGTHTVSV
jgi:ATP-dependent RNA helicase SUPV3L1/SUV3